jgi:glycosyltransferase involved in cell wall biosynthesis
MRIAVLSTEGVGFGGAVRATLRLVAGLSERGHEATVISLAPGHDPGGIGIEALPARDDGERLARAAGGYLQNAYIGARRTALSNTLFSPQVAGYSFKESPLLDDFDVVNVHWVARFLAPHTAAEIVATDKPVVFTLHDMLAFTGGCHFSAGCQGYRASCTPCPQLKGDVLDLAAWTLAEKRRLLRPTAVAAITPSHWLAECAARSGVFAPERIRTIPNGVEIDLFRPTRKHAAKASLGIDPGVKTLLFGAGNTLEHRKGFDLAIETLERLKGDPRIQSLLAAERLRVLVFGEGTPELAATGVPLLDLGAVRNDARLALLYNAADLLILPSREDNLPNVMLEAMACGTLVVSFAVGGIPDVIADGVDGRLIAPFDTIAMASAVTDLLHAEGSARAMGAAARDKIASAYSLDAQAAAYEALFEGMLAEIGRRPTESRSDRARGPSTVGLPVTLNPEVDETPIGLFLEQQAIIDETTRAHERARAELDRVHRVLDTAAHDILRSSSWRYTSPLRRGAPEPRIGADATAGDAAAMVLSLLRSRSWELTAPMRLIARGGRGASRPPHPEQTPGQFDPPVTPEAPALPASSSVVLLDGGSLTRRPRPIDPGRSLNPICLHLYHLDLWDEFKTHLKPLIDQDTPLYISLPESNAHFIDDIYRDIDERYVRLFVLENRGLDIYPFLSQFKSLLDQGIRPLTLTKLHTKKSSHHSDEFAETWRKGLYQTLLTHHGAIVDEFHDRTLGMVCGRRWWVHEPYGHPNYAIERRVIQEACKTFNVSPSYYYVTGSMYIVSFDYLENLFSEIDLEAFLARFEHGYRPSDTPAHGFERVVCYGLEKYGLKIGLL